MKAKLYLFVALMALINSVSLSVFSQGTTAQLITFTTIPNKTTTSTAFTITAVAQSGLPVSFAVTSGGTVASVSGNTVTLSGTAGVVTIQATQSGDASFAAATPVSRTFTVSKVSQRITFATIPTKYINSAPFTLSATASSGLTVSYSISGPASISGSTVTLTGATGTVSITASQAGDATYNAATSITRTFTVSKLNQTISFSTIATKLVNAAPFALAATSSSGLAVSYSITGPATISGSTVTLTGTTGTVSITASQTGDATYNAATSVTKSFSVTKVSQTISFPTIANKLVNAAPFTLSATASSGLTVSYAISGPATISGTTVTLTGTAGTVIITASQAGNSTYKAATSVIKRVLVSKLSQTITFNTLAPKFVNSAPITLAATSSSGLTVTYSVSGPATLSGSTLTLSGTAGTVTVTASQAGDATYSAARNVVRSFVVSKLSQTITWTAIPAKYTNSADFSVSATASSGLTVTYSVVSGPATISGGTVSLTGVAGTVTLKATQAGDASYYSKTQNMSFTVSTPVVARVMPADDGILSNVSFYPNPSKGSIFIENAIIDTKVSIIDQQGTIKLHYNINNELAPESIDVSNLDKGMYYIKFESGKNVTQKIFVKE